MINVLNAGALHGYDSNDHLIEEDELKDIIGLSFRSVGDALRAADNRCYIARHGNHKRCSHPYTWIEVRMANGEIREHKSV